MSFNLTWSRRWRCHFASMASSRSHESLRVSCGSRGRVATPSVDAQAHLLQCARGLIQGDRATQGGAFKAVKGQAAASAHELGGKRLGILGFGRIAREIAWLCVAFGMDVAAHSPSLDADEAYESGVLFAESPVIFARSILCCPAP